MRKLLLVGDAPSTGGIALPHGFLYVGKANGIDHMIVGGQVFCNACNSTGLIEKAGGPSRRRGDDRELALEGDILNCRCSVPPVMLSNSDISWLPRHDDQIEELGQYRDFNQQRAGVSSLTSSQVFDEKFILRNSDYQPIDNGAYAIERSSGAIEYGVTNDMGQTHLLSSVAASENINFYLAG